MLTVIAAAALLLGLCAAPVHIAFRLRLSEGIHFSLGVSLFTPGAAHKRARKQKSVRKPPVRLHPSDALPAAASALKHLRILALKIGGVFGSDDAALTALVCGLFSSIACTLRCTDGKKNLIVLRPDFSCSSLHADLSGMISIRAGHIMIAALHGAYQYGLRRLKKWTSIPLKAS